MDTVRLDAPVDFREGNKPGKSFIGMPVVSLANGERMGTVHDVVYSAREGRVLYFTVPVAGGMFGSGKTLLLDAADIKSVGNDAITIENSDLLREQDRNVKSVAEDSGESIVGKRLMTEDGDNLGAIDDVLVNPTTFRILAYQVSGGLWHDLMRGQTDVPVEMVTTVGKDVVVVPSGVKAYMDRSSGGLLRAASAAQGHIDSALTTAAESIEEREADYALGKTSGSDVTFEDGGFLIRKGETITESHIQEAMVGDRMHALAAAAGFHAAGEAWDSTREKAGQAWDATKAKVGEKQGDLLIGRTTARAVLDEAGMTVVPEAKRVDQVDVDKARAAGKLNDLTAAVIKDALPERKSRSQTYVEPAPMALPATSREDVTL
ncbi:hypothetical protein BH11ARM2_BH11ARM2_30700 [soil metagenome]